MFNDDQIKALSAKLDAAHVKSRSQAGRSLSYIEGWHAIAEANRIFGFDAWDRTLSALKALGEPREVDGKWRVAYMATVRITVRTVDAEGIQETTRDGTGYGSGIDRDLGSAHESAIKEAETDAMKRALMTFGNPFGLALYDKTQENVETNPSSAPQQGRNAAPANSPQHSSRSAAAAPLSDVYKAFLQTMKMSRSKAELREWFFANKESIAQNLSEQESLLLVGERNTLAMSLPEHFEDAA